MRVICLVLGLGMGCGPEKVEADDPCVGLCDNLVSTCQVAAFPSVEECQSACAFGAELGANILAYRVCLDAVDDCDTFGIVECENENGW